MRTLRLDRFCIACAGRGTSRLTVEAEREDIQSDIQIEINEILRNSATFIEEFEAQLGSVRLLLEIKKQALDISEMISELPPRYEGE